MRCRQCGAEFETRLLTNINTSGDPTLKTAVMDGSLFVHECPKCGCRNLQGEPLLYHDPDQKILIALTSAAMSSDGLEGYTCRIVSTIGELIEKVKLFEAGLDDITLELCKYVTLQEMKKEVDLKFLKIDGSDGEITMTYPEKGEMQMIVTGYNVYSDCAGIIQRNPAIREAAQGLTRVDQNWISGFIRG